MRVRRFHGVLILAAAAISGWLLARFSIPKPIVSTRSPQLLTPGPWGQLEVTPITIAPPDDILPIRDFEERGTHWIFGDISTERLSEMLELIKVPPRLRAQMLSPAMLHDGTNGLEILPSPEVVFALPPATRINLYRALKSRATDRSSLSFRIATKDFDERFGNAGLRPATIARLRQMAAPYNDSLLFFEVPCLLSTLTDYDEKARLLKALIAQQTMLLRLRVTPDSDARTLAAYWGGAGLNTDLSALLESLKQVPGGASIDVIELLPPLPASLLYTFEIPKNPLAGPVAIRNCHWTTLNFFRDIPDDHCGETEYATARLQSEYEPVTSEPHYGDLVLFGIGNAEALHSAVYLAAGIVYTKNGKSPILPWMLSTVNDLAADYSFAAAEGEKVVISYYRHKATTALQNP